MKTGSEAERAQGPSGDGPDPFSPEPQTRPTWGPALSCSSHARLCQPQLSYEPRSPCAVFGGGSGSIPSSVSVGGSRKHQSSRLLPTPGQEPRVREGARGCVRLRCAAAGAPGPRQPAWLPWAPEGAAPLFRNCLSSWWSAVSGRGEA